MHFLWLNHTPKLQDGGPIPATPEKFLSFALIDKWITHSRVTSHHTHVNSLDLHGQSKRSCCDVTLGMNSLLLILWPLFKRP